MDAMRSAFRDSPGLGLLPLFLVAACGGSAGAAERRPNVLLITIDTLRADRLGTYGYGRDSSPEIDAFARTATVFEHCQAPSSWTLPSLASLMTSMYSSTHGCWAYQSPLDDSYPTLAETLATYGYDTAAVASHVFLNRRYGLTQGIEYLDDEMIVKREEGKKAITSHRVTAKAKEFLRRKANGEDDRPWFLWAHYFDPHEYYNTHEGISEAFGTETEEDLYVGEIAYTSRFVGELIAALDELGLADETIVVLTADHGEEFGDHGGRTHGKTLFREVLHVPLVIRVPGIEPGRVRSTVRTIDVLPTLLEATDLPSHPDFQGTSLLTAMRGEPTPPLPALAELRLRSFRLDSYSDGRWKLVLDMSEDVQQLYLFDLDRDPLEQHDVAADQPEVVARVKAEMEAMIAKARSLAEKYVVSPEISLSLDEIRHLRDLGYAAGGVRELEEEE